MPAARKRFARQRVVGIRESGERVRRQRLQEVATGSCGEPKGAEIGAREGMKMVIKRPLARQIFGKNRGMKGLLSPEA